MKEVHIMKDYFLSNDRHGCRIEGIDLVGTDGRTLQLRPDGSIYSYGLTLKSKSIDTKGEIEAS